jgi:hypothetical protein
MASWCCWVFVGVSLMAELPTCVMMSPCYGGYQTATPPPNYTITRHATSGYYTTKVPDYCTKTYDAPSYYTERRSITLPRATLPKSRSTTPMLPSTTTLRHRNTTPLSMISLPNTPRSLITTAPKRLSTTTLPRATKPTPRSYYLRKRSRIKWERKYGRNQSSVDLRHDNKCIVLSFTNCIP